MNPAQLIGNYSLNNRVDVSFNASLENGESAFYVHSQDTLYLVAGTGHHAPRHRHHFQRGEPTNRWRSPKR